MRPNSILFTIFLGVLAALPAVSIDISAPTLVVLPSVLDTTSFVAGLTISLFMVGFALGQLLGGGSSDRLGRKPVLLAGLVLYGTASIICGFSSTGPGLVSARFVQGIGAGICAVISFAIIQDLFAGAAARSKRAYVTVVVGAAPMLAPAVGALILWLVGWRPVHLVLAIAGIMLLAVVKLWLAESLPERRPAELVVERAEPSGKLWQDDRFVNLTIVNALSYGSIFAYIAGSPVVVMEYFHGSSRSYAAVFACTALCQTAGAWSSGRLARRGLAAEALLATALATSAVASLALAAVFLANRALSAPAALCLLCLIAFCRGIISPNLQHLAIERQRQRAGTASAAFGVSQLLGGAASSLVVAGLLSALGPFAVVGPIGFCSIAAAAMWWWTTRSDVRPGSSHQPSETLG
jgi:DHA1 family bicyclomycin/chloramphenicol resistance-like MFS transporter